jgi:hypothetical protein
MAKVFPLASKKGMPRVNLNSNNLSCYDADMLQEIYDDYTDAYIKHRKDNLYGQGTAPIRKHGDTKPRSKNKVDTRSNVSFEVSYHYVGRHEVDLVSSKIEVIKDEQE